MAGFGFTSDCDLTENNPVRLRCTQIDAAFLPTFGIQPLAGRNFTPAEDTPNAAKVALITYGLWMKRYGGDRAILGQSIRVDGKPTTVIGILPRDFELFNLSSTDILTPVALLPDQAGRVVRAFARLKPGVSIAQARAALEPLFEEARGMVWAAFRPNLSLVVRSLRDRQIWTVRTASWTFLAAVMLVLFLACANVANLLLARAAGRRRELAVRRALGASRARLVRQTITESLLLAFAGTVAGCLLGSAILRFFIAIAPDGITRLDRASLDGRVLLFAIAVSVAAGVLFGLAPALRDDTNPRATGFVRHGLITAQIAGSLVLLTAAGLLLRSLWSLERVPLGMNTDRVVTAHFVLSKTYTPARLNAFYDDLESRIARMPGVLAAAISSSVPPYGGVMAVPYSALNVEGRPRLPEGTGGSVAYRIVTPRYFAALEIPIRRGRPFDESDRAPRVASIILGESLARRLFPGEDPVGRRIFQSEDGGWQTVVGVAADVRNNGLVGPQSLECYQVSKHSFANSASVLVRTPLAPQAIAAMLRAEIAQLDSALPVEFQTMRERVARLTGEPRFNAWLLSGFAATGLMLAAIGIYGVIAFLVTRRTREIGVRIALGATPSRVTAHFLSDAARWTAAGILLGLAGSLAATRLLGSLLFAVPAKDPWSFLASSAILASTALVAAWLPSRRAARIDAMRTLREE
jgi:predicted permease